MKISGTLTTAAAVVTVAVRAGKWFLKLDGTWGSGTVTATFSDASGGTFDAIGSGVALSANGTTEFDLGDGDLKLTLAGSTGATVGYFLSGVAGRAASDA